MRDPRHIGFVKRRIIPRARAQQKAFAGNIDLQAPIVRFAEVTPLSQRTSFGFLGQGDEFGEFTTGLSVNVCGCFHEIQVRDDSRDEVSSKVAGWSNVNLVHTPDRRLEIG